MIGNCLMSGLASGLAVDGMIFVGQVADELGTASDFVTIIGCSSDEASGLIGPINTMNTKTYTRRFSQSESSAL
jgi:hypothetical protein